MKYWMLIFFGAWVILPSLAWSNDQARRLGLVYEREQERIEDEFRASRLALPQRYMTELRNVEWQYYLAQDHIRVRDIQNVRQQFTIDPMPSSLRSTQGVAEVEDLRAQYEREYLLVATTRTEHLAALQEQYRSALTRLQASLRREGQDVEARQVGERLASLRSTRLAADPDDELDIDLGLDDEPVAARPARTEAPATRPAPQPRAPAEHGDVDPFDALMEEWLD